MSQGKLPTIKQPYPGVIHVVYNTQLELTRAFMRMQEFYESPLVSANGNAFKGRYFTRKEYEAAYMKECDTDFCSYYGDWNGFNVPGHIVDSFLSKFSDLDRYEIPLIAAISQYLRDDEKYYVIGTAVNGKDCVDHELAHAMWYLDKAYREFTQTLLGHVRYSFDNIVRSKLRKMGYCGDMIDDEMQAYLSTSSMPEVYDHFGYGDNIDWSSILGLQLHFRSSLLEK